ncbi:MAG: hypothetical protein COS40_03565, partial [Deltaproteobacteria bacterium CG03_land_8_20_14_0_80_45_14]
TSTSTTYGEPPSHPHTPPKKLRAFKAYFHIRRNQTILLTHQKTTNPKPEGVVTTVSANYSSLKSFSSISLISGFKTGKSKRTASHRTPSFIYAYP